MNEKLCDYLHVIQSNFPEIQFNRGKLIEKGWDNDVVLLDDRYVFRFPKRDKYKKRLKWEVTLLDSLEPLLPLSVPDYEFVPEDVSFGGYKMIPGNELTLTVFSQLTQNVKSKIALQLGSFITELHRAPVSLALDAGFGEEEQWWTRKNIEGKYIRIREKVFPKLTEDEKKWAIEQMDAYLELSSDFNKVIVHNDIAPDHIFFSDDHVSGITDFADVEVSDPALDFMGLWFYGEPFVNEVLKHYLAPVDIALLNRSKVKLALGIVIDLLEIVECADIPMTFNEGHHKLQEMMRLPIWS